MPVPRSRAALSLLLLALPAAPQAAAQQGQPPRPIANAPQVLRAHPLAGELRIDGRLDEPAWRDAEVASDFIQAQPNFGAPASQRTEARVIYGPDALFVGMRMYDTAPDSIAGRLTRRDEWSGTADWAMVYVDSRHDHRTAFGFAINPMGVKHDSYFFDDGRQDTSWDAVWEGAVTVDSLGWTAEFRIPYSQLRYDLGAAEMTWGIQFMRQIARHGESSHWAPRDPRVPGMSSRFGVLTGLEGIRAPRRVELLPYTSARLERAPDEPGNPFYRANRPGAGVGLDARVGLPAGLTLTATLNPDFGQVEVDPAQINLSAFELFFPERRPFFIEGGDVFRFGDVQTFNNYGFQEFFYSRRIGRTPQRSLGGPGYAAVDAPDQTTILGAAKVSGRTGRGWTVGAMNALTGREHARAVNLDGDELNVQVEPFTSYSVGRARREWRRGQTVVGGVVTATHRDLSDETLQAMLRGSAYLGGVDFEHRWANRQWALSGFLAGSHVAGSETSIAATQRAPSRYFTRPDADYLTYDAERGSLGGTMGQVAVQRSGNWDFSVSYKDASPGFEINDAGFQGRVDYRSVATMVGQRFPRPFGPFRTASYALLSLHNWNHGGDRFTHDYAAGVTGTFQNFWGGGVTVIHQRESYDDRLTRGGPLARSPEGWQLNAQLGTDPRRPLRLQASGSGGEWEDGTRSRNLAFDLVARPTSNVELRLGPSLSRNENPRQFVTAFGDPAAEATFGRRTVFADLEQTVAAANLRLNWTFTPDLSLQLFAQPYVAAGSFAGFKEFTTPGETRFDVYGADRGTLCRYADRRAYAVHPTAAVDCPEALPTPTEAAAQGLRLLGDPDFTFRSLRGNAVVRWEYSPGSALFLVWQQTRSGTEAFGDVQLSRDAGDLLREPARNVFLLKATYWIGR
jgi:hypothetical protein